MIHVDISPARKAAASLLELMFYTTAEHRDVLDQHLEESQPRFQQVIEEVAEAVFDPDADEDLALDCAEDLCGMLHRLLKQGLILSRHLKLREELIELMHDFGMKLDLRDESFDLAGQAIKKAMRTGKEGGAR